MTEPQPEYVWAFPPDERPNRRRLWLIVGLAVAAVAIAAALFFLFFRPGSPVAEPTPSPSSSPTSSPTATSSPTPTATASPTPAASASAEPTAAPEPPAPVDPDLETFRGKVGPILSDADRGLSIAAESDSVEAAQTIDLLVQDAGRLADSVPPDSIAGRWFSAVDAYAGNLQALRSAYERGESGDRESDAARDALDRVNELIGAR